MNLPSQHPPKSNEERVAELTSIWASAPTGLKRTTATFAKYPTERNKAYAIGYLVALNDHGLLPMANYSPWHKLLSTLIDDELLRHTISTF